jgi:hypothetical protein
LSHSKRRSSTNGVSRLSLAYHSHLASAVTTGHCCQSLWQTPWPECIHAPGPGRRWWTSHQPHKFGLPCPGRDRRRQTLQTEFFADHLRWKPLPGDLAGLRALFKRVVQNRGQNPSFFSFRLGHARSRKVSFCQRSLKHTE